MPGNQSKEALVIMGILLPSWNSYNNLSLKKEKDIYKFRIFYKRTDMDELHIELQYVKLQSGTSTLV